MRRIFLFVLSITLITAFSAAQSLVTATSPEAGGFSSERLKVIDTKLQEWVNQKWMTGAVALIIHDGKIVYQKAVGYDNKEKGILMKSDELFRIASQTKAITSVGIMMLYEDGKLLLDDAVSKYIPEFKNPQVLDKYTASDTTYTTVKAKREITIRDLLTHTSGIGYAQIGSQEANAIYAKNSIPSGIGVPPGPQLGKTIKKLGSLPLMHQPGERFTYGLNVDVLGYVIEVVSGTSLDNFFHTKIFAPLGMNDTYFYLPKEKRSRLSTLNVEDSTGVHAPSALQYAKGAASDYPNTAGTYFSGGAGLTSSITDYAIFLQMLLNGGTYNGKRILSRNTIRLMTTNQIGDLNVGVDKFGLGFSIATEKSAARLPVSVGTYGWGGAFATTYWVDPKEKIIAQLYTQIWGRRHNVEDAFKVLVYQALNN